MTAFKRLITAAIREEKDDKEIPRKELPTLGTTVNVSQLADNSGPTLYLAIVEDELEESMGHVVVCFL